MFRRRHRRRLVVGAGSDDRNFDPDDPPEAVGGGDIDAVRLTFEDGTPAMSASGGESLVLSVGCSMTEAEHRPHLLFTLRNPMGQIVFAGDSRDHGDADRHVGAGVKIAWEFCFDLPFLPTGSYPLDVFLLSDWDGASTCLDRREQATVVQVLSQHVSSGMANVAMDRVLLMVGAAAD